jgi:site-specific recombinase XerC
VKRLSACIAEYLVWATEETTYTRATLRTYGPNLRAFLRWIEADEDTPAAPTLDDFTLPVLYRFLKYLKTKPSKNQRGLRPRSIHSQFAPLNSFGDWLVKRGDLAANPVPRIELPKKDEVQRPPNDALLDAQGAARLLCCSPRSVRRLVPPVRRGRWRRSDILRFIQQL